VHRQVARKDILLQWLTHEQEVVVGSPGPAVLDTDDAGELEALHAAAAVAREPWTAERDRFEAMTQDAQFEGWDG
jgi:hypothetical protein